MYKYITQTNWPHQPKLLFLNTANVYFRPTGYHIKPTLSRWKGCLPAKAKMKKTPQPFKRQLNCWKQLKLKPPTLCTRILDGPQKHWVPALCHNHRARDTSGVRVRTALSLPTAQGKELKRILVYPGINWAFLFFLLSESQAVENIWLLFEMSKCSSGSVKQGCTGSSLLFNSWELEPCDLERATKWCQEHKTWFHINCPVSGSLWCRKVCFKPNCKLGTGHHYPNHKNPVHY